MYLQGDSRAVQDLAAVDRHLTFRPPAGVARTDAPATPQLRPSVAAWDVVFTTAGAAQTGRSRPLTTPDSVFPGRRHRQSPCRGRPRSATSGHSSVTAVRQPIAGGPRRSRRQSRRWRSRPLPLSALNSARTSCLRCRRTVRSSRTRRWRTWGAATARPPPPHGQPRWRSHRR